MVYHTGGKRLCGDPAASQAYEHQKEMTTVSFANRGDRYVRRIVKVIAHFETEREKEAENSSKRG